MQPEQWKMCDAPYMRYLVSSYGKVRDTTKGRNLRISQSRMVTGKPGYMKASLVGEDGVRKLLSVHRLVAKAFVAGDHTLDVNHKDMDKTNNHAPNLEWTTHANNIRHGMANHPTWKLRLTESGQRRGRTVVATASDGTETEHSSVNQAGVAMGARNKAANIWWAIEFGQKAYGFNWRYKHANAS